MPRIRFYRTIAAAGAFCCLAGAVETQTWQQASYEDFDKGNREKIALRSDGLLTLAPPFKELLDSASPYLWALAEDSKGNLYAGGGGPGDGASVYVVAPDGKSRRLAKLEGFEVHALAIDRKDRLYAATSPDGKIYRIASNGSSEVFYSPGEKYIWALAFDSKGNLYAATGDEGHIHRIAPDGKGAVFYRTEETHARSLALDGNGNLIVGTDPGGLILRITPAGEGFVLHQAAKREITSVAVAQNGTVYAAAAGAKQPAVAPPPPLPKPPVSPAKPSVQQTTSQPPQQPTPPAVLPSVIPAAEGSELYRIDPDGYPRRVWNQAKDLVYAIAFDPEGRLLVGTGNKGIVYRIDSDHVFTALASVQPTQVTALCTGQRGKVYAATGNIGKVFQIGPGIEKEGSIESEVLDAGIFSLWGRLAYRGDLNGGAIRVETRSGNLDRPRKDWSPWQPVEQGEAGGRIQSPQARFLQWKLTLSPPKNGDSPGVRSVDVAYLPKNVAPVVEQIEVTPPNYRFPLQSLTLTPSQTLTLQPLGRPRRTPPTPGLIDSGVVSMQYAKGYIGARWAASDENGDGMIYNVEIRGSAESEWKPLKDKLKEKYLSWDSTAFPDGEYRLRVTATDSPDNPPDQALSAQLVSERFVIDNSPPEITGMSVSQTGGSLEVRWKARDVLSVIEKAEYSLNGGEWTFVEPVTKLSDSKELEYRLVLEKLQPGEKTVAVRVADEFENQAVAKAVAK